MYRTYISQTDYDEIVHRAHPDNPNIFPHCNTTMFHEPGICPYCDGYYLRHPEFRPANYVTREANGWGGNMAPIVDDEKAAAEQAVWVGLFRDFED